MTLFWRGFSTLRFRLHIQSSSVLELCRPLYTSIIGTYLCDAGEKNLRAIVKGWNVDDYLSYQTELRIWIGRYY